jgi:hypothetical protein
MSSILKSRLGRASIALAVAASAIVALGASAEARPYERWHNGYYHHEPYRWDHARYYGYRGWYGPRYYAPPVVAYPPPVYYGPPSLNFNIPLG